MICYLFLIFDIIVLCSALILYNIFKFFWVSFLKFFNKENPLFKPGMIECKAEIINTKQELISQTNLSAACFCFPCTGCSFRNVLKSHCQNSQVIFLIKKIPNKNNRYYQQCINLQHVNV